MNDSFHDRNSQLLANLSSLEIMSGVLDRIGARDGWWDETRRWKLSSARIIDPLEVRVQLAFETTDGPVEICVIDRGPTGLVAGAAIGPMTVSRFPDDSKLPTLR